MFIVCISKINSFKKKFNKIAICVYISIICAIVQASLGVMTYWTNITNVMMGLVISPIWVMLVQATTWCYVFRINNFMNIQYTTRHRYWEWLPWIILAGQLPVIVLFNIAKYNDNAEIIAGLVIMIYNIVVILIEIVLYIKLAQQVMYLLEYRPTFKKKLLFEMFIGLWFIVLIDILLIVSIRHFDDVVVVLVKATSYNFRILIVILFYDILIEELIIRLPEPYIT